MLTGELAGKVVIVTGGNSGIGEATVHLLAHEGARVAILARREAEGRAVACAVSDAGGEATFLPCDVTERAAIEAAIGAVVEQYGGLHVLVNNAGGGFPHGLDEAGDEGWERTLRLNLTSAYMTTQVAWPHLRAAGGASVVNVSSTAAVAAFSQAQLADAPGIPGGSPGYYAAKAGLEALTRYTAMAGAPHRIRANVVRPGQILTPMATRRTPGRHGYADFFDRIQLTPGTGRPEDVAHAIVFLASGAAAFINGQVLNVDGGSIVKVQ